MFFCIVGHLPCSQLNNIINRVKEHFEYIGGLWNTFKNLLMFICFWERETECEQGRCRERGRHRIWSRLQSLSCHHRTWLRAQTHKPWDYDVSQSLTLNWLSHPGAHEIHFWTYILGFISIDVLVKTEVDTLQLASVF